MAEMILDDRSMNISIICPTPAVANRHGSHHTRCSLRQGERGCSRSARRASLCYPFPRRQVLLYCIIKI